MSKKFIFGFLLFFLFVGILFIAITYPSQNTTPKYTGPVEKITIGNIGEYSIFNIIAQEKGYFKDHGLDVTIKEYVSGPHAIADLLTGKLAFAVAADFVGVRNSFINNDLQILTQASKHKVFQVVARRDKGISIPIDLKGKTIGVTRKGAGEFHLGRFLLLNNLQLKDIIIRDLTPQQMSDQLRDGNLDAIVIFDPHAYTLKKELGDSIVNWSAQGDQNIFALEYTTKSYLAAHSTVAFQYMRALLQAEQLVKEHPEEAQQIIIEKLHYESAYVHYMWSNFIFSNELNQELLLTMEDEARWAIENKLTDQTIVPNYLDFIYFPALEQVKPEAITIIR